MQVPQEWISAKNKYSKAQNLRLTFEGRPSVTMSLHATWRSDVEDVEHEGVISRITPDVTLGEPKT